ncbi:MAG: DUF1549 domain-containing protein [Rubripirellula sp.]
MKPADEVGDWQSPTRLQSKILNFYAGSTMLARHLILLFASLAINHVVSVAAENAEPTVSQTIDRMLAESWEADSITATPPSDDAEFLRRAWLDLAGVAPPVWEVRSFLNNDHLNDDDPSDRRQKRIELIDRLLQSPQHAVHMAARWTDAMLPSSSQTDPAQRPSVAALQEWLRLQFLANTPYDHLVGKFLTAGGAGDSGPAIFYTSNSLQPEKLAAATSRIFMGIQIQCAQCHDHPMDRWTQEDFWAYAAFFSQLSSTDSGMNRQAILEDRPGGEVHLPDTETIVAPRYPGVASKPERDPADNRRRQLTIWLASQDNPYFARAAVNRVWGHLFGQGIVDPVDAMDAANTPSHPRLLDYLADQFTAHRFDLRWLYRTLAITDAYGHTSRLGDDVPPPPSSFAAMPVKTLSAAQFYDSMAQNVFHRTDDAIVINRDQFLTRMSFPGSSPRDYPLGMIQILALLNGDATTLATDPNQSGLMAAVEAPFFDDSTTVETVFMATVSRRPTETETATFVKHLGESDSPNEKHQAISDMVWVLINSAESAMCP